MQDTGYRMKRKDAVRGFFTSMFEAGRSTLSVGRSIFNIPTIVIVLGLAAVVVFTTSCSDEKKKKTAAAPTVINITLPPPPPPPPPPWLAAWRKSFLKGRTRRK